jgi:signal transduction histidine kinase
MPAQSTAIPAAAPRVLCILDAASPKAEVRVCLEQAGFQVTEAGTGMAGVAAAVNGSPDLVLVDFHLPDIEGTAVATHLRRRQAGLPIVAFTAAGHDHKMALSAGCSGVVELPTDLSALPLRLREFLAGKSERLRSTEEARLLKEYSAGLVESLEGKIRELTDANRRLTAIDQFKTEFLQSMAHELSSPLTPITGYLRILQSDRLGTLNEKQTKVIEAMLQSADRLGRTIESLGDFASLQTGECRLALVAMDPAVLLSEVVGQKHLIARAKRIRVRTRGLQLGELSVACDGRRLQQAMGTLVENAIKYSPAGSDVLVDLTSSQGTLRFSVFDQGVGVPRGEQESIFEPFHHTDRAGAGECAGAGLGLALARQIVQAHGGSIGVESPPRQQPEQGRHFSGANFHFEIRTATTYGSH